MNELLLCGCLFGIATLLTRQRKYIKELEEDIKLLENEYFRGFNDGKKAAYGEHTFESLENNNFDDVEGL